MKLLGLLRRRRGARWVAAGFWVLGCVRLLAFDEVRSVAGAGDFRLYLDVTNYVESGLVTNYVLLSGSNRFAFYAPAGWAVRLRSRDRLVEVMPTNGNALLRIRWDGSATEASLLSLQGLRSRAQTNRPQARLAREFRCGSGCGEAYAFDLLQAVGPGVTAGIRHAFVPMTNGLLEFELTAKDVRTLTNSDRVFFRLMASFRPLAVRPGASR